MMITSPGYKVFRFAALTLIVLVLVLPIVWMVLALIAAWLYLDRDSYRDQLAIQAARQQASLLVLPEASIVVTVERYCVPSETFR